MSIVEKLEFLRELNKGIPNIYENKQKIINYFGFNVLESCKYKNSHVFVKDTEIGNQRNIFKVCVCLPKIFNDKALSQIIKSANK